jgi:hypothetical protein
LFLKYIFTKIWTRDYRVGSLLYNHYPHCSVNDESTFLIILQIIRISLQWYTDISWYHDTMYRLIEYLKNHKNHRQFPTMTRFHGSKFERYRVIDLFTAIILNIGFRVCKWTGVPEKRVQSFAFYMGDVMGFHYKKWNLVKLTIKLSFLITGLIKW